MISYKTACLVMSALPAARQARPHSHRITRLITFMPQVRPPQAFKHAARHAPSAAPGAHALTDAEAQARITAPPPVSKPGRGPARNGRRRVRGWTPRHVPFAASGGRRRKATGADVSSHGGRNSLSRVSNPRRAASGTQICAQVMRHPAGFAMPPPAAPAAGTGAPRPVPAFCPGPGDRLTPVFPADYPPDQPPATLPSAGREATRRPRRGARLVPLRAHVASPAGAGGACGGAGARGAENHGRRDGGTRRGPQKGKSSAISSSSAWDTLGCAAESCW
jgi:hypothetical protein